MEWSHAESRQPGLGMLCVHKLVCINQDGKARQTQLTVSPPPKHRPGCKSPGGSRTRDPGGSMPQSTSPRSLCTFLWQRGFCPRGFWKISAGWSGKGRKQLQLLQLFSRYPAHTLSLEAKTFLQSLVLMLKV